MVCFITISVWDASSVCFITNMLCKVCFLMGLTHSGQYSERPTFSGKFVKFSKVFFLWCPNAWTNSVSSIQSFFSPKYILHAVGWSFLAIQYNIHFGMFSARKNVTNPLNVFQYVSIDFKSVLFSWENNVGSLLVHMADANIQLFIPAKLCT